MVAESIVIEPVSTRKQLREFVLFPFQVYRGDPNWVPPLISDRMAHFDPRHNPFYQHAAVQLFVARRNGRIVGTIAATDDEAHKATWNESVVGGALEVLPDYEAAAALFDAHAPGWHGHETMRPIDLNVNADRLLIEGRDSPPWS